MNKWIIKWNHFLKQFTSYKIFDHSPFAYLVTLSRLRCGVNGSSKQFVTIHIYNVAPFIRRLTVIVTMILTFGLIQRYTIETYLHVDMSYVVRCLALSNLILAITKRNWIMAPYDGFARWLAYWNWRSPPNTRNLVIALAQCNRTLIHRLSSIFYSDISCNCCRIRLNGWRLNRTPNNENLQCICMIRVCDSFGFTFTLFDGFLLVFLSLVGKA